VSGLPEALTAIAVSQNFSLALRKNGTALVWGRNQEGELGIGAGEAHEPEHCGPRFVACSTVPRKISELSEATDLIAGGSFGLALLSSGSVKRWGDCADGQFGNGKQGSGATNFTPVEAMTGQDQVTAVPAGQNFSLATLHTGEVIAAGANPSGQLGDESKGNSSVPLKVKELTGTIGIAGGPQHGVAIGW
jgi:alpha-tubulin suppressor-like RCC1 family protein